MDQIITWARASRAGMLWLTVPMALLWSPVSGSGGVLMVIAHSLLVLLYLTTLDARLMGGGLEARLTILRGRAADAVGVSRLVSAAVGIGLLLVLVLLVFESVWIAGICAAGGVLIVALVARASRGSLAWRMRWAEFLWAAVVVIGPMVVIRAIAMGRQEKELAEQEGVIDGLFLTVTMSPGVVWASVLGGIGVGVYVLLCLVRDMAIDAGDGIKTSATGLGDTAARVAVTVWLIAGMAVAAFVASNGLLGTRTWGILTIYGVTALVAQGMVWAREADRAVVVWWLGSGLVGALCVAALA